MNLGQMKARVQARLGRYDIETTALIESWIKEQVKEVEKAYPFAYLRRDTTEYALTSTVNRYTLPALLIPQHPFTLVIEDLSDTNARSSPLVFINDQWAALNIPSPRTQGDSPAYYILQGGVDGKDFDVYPMTNAARDMEMYGYFYTDTSAWDSNSSNYLLNEYPKLILERVCEEGYNHFGEYEQADRARNLALAHMNGDRTQGIIGAIQAEKRRGRDRLYNKIKTFDELPLLWAQKKRGL